MRATHRFCGKFQIICQLSCPPKLNTQNLLKNIFYYNNFHAVNNKCFQIFVNIESLYTNKYTKENEKSTEAHFQLLKRIPTKEQ